MLAWLNNDDRVSSSYLAESGTQILVEGSPGTTTDALVELYSSVLAASSLVPAQLPPEQARVAWAARESAEWVAAPDLWRLSWSEAEIFADRLLVGLVGRFGEPARSLRPLLVESYFEGVRPDDGQGPISTHWPRGASSDERQRVVVEAAREWLPAEDVLELIDLLADDTWEGSLLRPR